MSRTTSAIVLAGNGTNCEMETAHACRLGGFDTVDIVTVWELVSGDASLDPYDILCLPGGFLDGDDLGSAKAQANRLLHTVVKKTGVPLFSQFTSFIKNGKLMLGICNGFQLMVKLGLLPSLSGVMSQQVTLTNNDSGRFEDRWVWLKANPASPCVFTKGIDVIYLPVRHGEGKFVARDTEVLDELRKHNQIVISYIDPDTQTAHHEIPGQSQWFAVVNCRHLRCHGPAVRPHAPPRSIFPPHQPPALDPRAAARGGHGPAIVPECTRLHS